MKKKTVLVKIYNENGTEWPLFPKSLPRKSSKLSPNLSEMKGNTNVEHRIEVS